MCPTKLYRTLSPPGSLPDSKIWSAKRPYWGKSEERMPIESGISFCPSKRLLWGSFAFLHHTPAQHTIPSPSTFNNLPTTLPRAHRPTGAVVHIRTILLTQSSQTAAHIQEMERTKVRRSTCCICSSRAISRVSSLASINSRPKAAKPCSNSFAVSTNNKGNLP